MNIQNMAIMEQPLTIAFVGIVIGMILLGGLIQTGRKSLLYGAIAAFLCTLGLVVLERVTITPREQVKATLTVIAHDLEQNDVEAIVDHVSPENEKLRGEARRRMGDIEITDVDIKRNLKVQLYEQHGSDYAEARFNCVIRFNVPRASSMGFDADQTLPQFFVVRFRNEEGHWRIRDYEMQDPRAGMGQ